jgi:hypothetical protein
MKNNHFLIKILTILLLFVYSGIGISQPVTWYRTWGPQNTQIHAQGKRVCQTFDGGYAVLSLISYSNNWFNLLKYDSFGNIQWVKLIIDSTTSGRMISDMQQTSDSGFIFAGFLPAGQGALLIKTDKFGNIKWQRSYPNLNSGTRFYNVKQTLDKGYIACGSYIDYVNPSTKGILIKADSLGYVQWEKQYMDSTFNTYSGIIQGFDKNYYIAGCTNNNQRPDYSLIKILDTLGNVINSNIFYQKSYMEYIVQLKDSSLITGGEDETTNTSCPLIAKFSPSGDIKWIKSYPSTFHFYFYYMSKDLFDNIIMTGGYDKYTYSTILNWKLDTSGTMLRINEIFYTGYTLIGTSCIKSTLDSGYILTGSADIGEIHKVITIKTDSAFNFPTISGINNIHSSISEKFIMYQNYPNPFNSSTLIKFYIPKNGIADIGIYNLLGKKVFTSKEYRYKGLNEKLINMSNMNLSSGIYFARINFEFNSELIKLIYYK